MVASKSRWYALGALSVSTLAVGLDTTVLSVALPTLARDLHASTRDLQWFTSAYLLVGGLNLLVWLGITRRGGRPRAGTVVAAIVLLVPSSILAVSLLATVGILIYFKLPPG